MLMELKKEAGIFQKRHGGVVESFAMAELEGHFKGMLRQLKKYLRVRNEDRQSERRKRNIFGTILHGIADVATGKREKL